MRALRIALVLAFLGAVWVLADGQAALARLAGAEAGWLLVAFVLIHAQTVLSALRWRMVAGSMGMPMAAGLAVREYYVAQLGNQSLPGGVAGDAARALRAREGGGLGPAAMAVAVERLAGQAALLLVLAAGMAWSLAFGAIRWPAAAWPVAGAGAVALVVLAAVLRHPRLTAARSTGWRALVADWPRQSALSLLIVAVNLCSLAAAARATGTVLSAEAIVTLLPLILTAMVLPLGIAGWGWREGAAALLFPLAGASAAAGVAASAAFGGLLLVAALPGALWLWRRPPPADRNITVS